MKKTAMFLTTLCVTVVSAAPAFAWGWGNNGGYHGGYCKVPEPSTLLMLGGAIAGMALLRKRFKK